MKTNSDLTLVPLEKKHGYILSLMGFITPVVERFAFTTGQTNEKNQTLLDRFRVLIKDTRFFDG